MRLNPVENRLAESSPDFCNAMPSVVTNRLANVPMVLKRERLGRRHARLVPHASSSSRHRQGRLASSQTRVPVTAAPAGRVRSNGACFLSAVDFPPWHRDSVTGIRARSTANPDLNKLAGLEWPLMIEPSLALSRTSS